jgi:hypothetical protein
MRQLRGVAYGAAVEDGAARTVGAASGSFARRRLLFVLRTDDDGGILGRPPVRIDHLDQHARLQLQPQRLVGRRSPPVAASGESALPRERQHAPAVPRDPDATLGVAV